MLGHHLDTGEMQHPTPRSRTSVSPLPQSLLPQHVGCSQLSALSGGPLLGVPSFPRPCLANASHPQSKCFLRKAFGAPQAHTFLPCTPAAPTTQSSLGNQHILACAVFSGGRSSFLKRMLPGASGWPLGTSGSPAKLISVKSCWLTDCGLLFHSQALLLLT